MREDVKILFEDNHILVVTKPQNLPVQKDESGDEDLLTVLKQYLIEKYNKSGDAYLGLVHRLDRPTGGVIVLLKRAKRRRDCVSRLKTGKWKKSISLSFAVYLRISKKNLSAT